MDVKTVKTVKVLKADTFIIFKSFIVFMVGFWIPQCRIVKTRPGGPFLLVSDRFRAPCFARDGSGVSLEPMFHKQVSRDAAWCACLRGEEA